MARCRELGVAAYLAKPISQLELLNALTTVAGTVADTQVIAAPVTRHSLRENHVRLKILLAEDNAVNQALGSALLRRRGHDVVIAESGRIALEFLYEQDFDLVLMDVEMPEMNGIQATAAIREREQQLGLARIPIVAMTAHALAGDRERCLQAGMDGYLTKPIQAKQLYETVEMAVRQPTVLSRRNDGTVVLDDAGILLGFEGDVSLMKQAAVLALETVPDQLTQAKRASQARDFKQVTDLARSINDSLSYFHAHKAAELASRLESVAAEALVENALAACEALEKELELLKPALMGLLHHRAK
jgi:CheY-like chemotaxis protein